MAKFYGRIGFTETVELAKGIWDQQETCRYYTGDLIRNQRRWINGESVNENLDLSNEVSILADDYLQNNIGAIKWVEVGGSKWKVNSLIMNYPRVQLTLGGLYNGG